MPDLLTTLRHPMDFHNASDDEIRSFLNIQTPLDTEILKSMNLYDLFSALPAREAGIAYAVLELSRRKEEAFVEKKIKMDCPQHIYEQFYRYMANLTEEEFWVLYLNTKMEILFRKRVFVGGFNEVYVDTRVVFKHALLLNAHCIVVAHNHPDGNLKPSAADDEVTKRLRENGKILNIHLVDHLIIAWKIRLKKIPVIRRKVIRFGYIKLPPSGHFKMVP